MRLGPVPPTVLPHLLADELQGFERVGAGVLEELTALQRRREGARVVGLGDNHWV